METVFPPPTTERFNLEIKSGSSLQINSSVCRAFLSSTRNKAAPPSTPLPSHGSLFFLPRRLSCFTRLFCTQIRLDANTLGASYEGKKKKKHVGDSNSESIVRNSV